MKLNIDKELFAVVPTGPLRQIEDFTFCPDESTAKKVVEEELDLSGQEMVVLKCRISIPVEFRDGELVVIRDGNANADVARF